MDISFINDYTPLLIVIFLNWTFNSINGELFEFTFIFNNINNINHLKDETLSGGLVFDEEDPSSSSWERVDPWEANLGDR